MTTEKTIARVDQITKDNPSINEWLKLTPFTDCLCHAYMEGMTFPFYVITYTDGTYKAVQEKP